MDMQDRAKLLVSSAEEHMRTWYDATERVGILIDDAIEHVEEALDGMSHLNVIRYFMYSTNAMAQYFRWLWIMGELTGLDPITQEDHPEIGDCFAVMGWVIGKDDIMGVFDEVKPWIRTLETVRASLPDEPGEFNMEAFAAMRKYLGDIVRIPTVKEAKYAPDQVPAVNTRALYLDDGSVYYADDEVLYGRPVGELALIAGGRLNRMHSQVVEQMTEATDADFNFFVAAIRLKQNSLIVKAFYDAKLQKKGTENENIGHGTTGSECATASCKRRIA